MDGEEHNEDESKYVCSIKAIRLKQRRLKLIRGIKTFLY